MEKVIIHYSEIGLKGDNRGMFEDKLVENIKKSADFQGVKLLNAKKQWNIVVCEFEDTREKVVSCLNVVFGIKYFYFFEEIEKDVEKIVKKVSKLLADIKSQGHDKISFNTKRSDKRFPLKSPELNARFGEVASDLGLKVDYSNAEKCVYVEITDKTCYVYDERILGPGGLPVGTSGKVLCLLSGGIDSPVAARQMMKRGCHVDFLHVHNLKSEKDVEKSKMKEVIDVLNRYQFRSQLHLVPYTAYEMGTIGEIPRNFELVFFKHYLLKLAERLVWRNKYKAIITGDNLAQVASQTMDNLRAASYSVSVPIFRPLLTYDKEEIIKVAREIGTYKPSIKQYKDCCSILAKYPQTTTLLGDFKEVLEKADVNKLVEESIKGIVCLK